MYLIQIAVIYRTAATDKKFASVKVIAIYTSENIPTIDLLYFG